MDSLQQASPTITLLCALACGLLIFAGGIGFVIVRSGLVARLVGQLETEDEAPVPRRAVRRPLRTRADQIRTQLDQEFDARLSGDPSAFIPDANVVPASRYARAADEGFDDPVPGKGRAASARRRFRRGLDDYDDEMDAYFDDTELS
ncbi:MAG: hypothetical protein HPY64_10060 [Anaerolineae bacterium]|nr:hypothetical protein [Anaerolineae bacterium]